MLLGLSAAGGCQTESAGTDFYAEGHPSQKYAFNPNYTGNSVLGIVSKGDIHYAKDGPANLEINASLISIDGKVAYEGIDVSSDGKQVSVDGSSLNSTKDSIRRLGGIVARPPMAGE